MIAGLLGATLLFGVPVPGSAADSEDVKTAQGAFGTDDRRDG